MLIEVDERLAILLSLALLSFCALGESGVMCLSCGSRVEIGVRICDLAVSRSWIVPKSEGQNVSRCLRHEGCLLAFGVLTGRVDRSPPWRRQRV